MREADARYFERLEAELDRAMAVAEDARERGGDPAPDVEIPVATDMADRVENLLGIPGVAERVRELEADHTREEAALALVEDFVEGTVGDFEDRAATIEGAVRTAVALLTEGVVAAPIEGIDRVEVLTNDDGTDFVNVYYAGPIRSAGGTAQALSVLVADYARSLLGIDEYRPRADEVGRYAEEVELYDEDTGLQYAPSEAETRFIAEHLPIMLDGEATGGEEVSGHRDLDRVDTNAPRGGMCLVLAEGIALKAPKIQRYTREIEAVDWPWLQDLIDGTYDGGEDGEESPTAPEPNVEPETPADGPPRVEPGGKYLRDLIAGRPVFSHPSRPGAFRLRYGRARNHGFATAGVHPATMHLVDDFLATGTQVKTERPGKAAGVVPVDSIEGPTVRLATGEVRRIDDPAEALEVRNGVEEVLDLGEYLVNYGEFVENNHALAPASYTVEWWRQEFEAAGGPLRELRDRADVDLEAPSPERALGWAREYDAPLHPAYTYLWHDISVQQVGDLAAAIDDAEVVAADGASLHARSEAGALSIPRRVGVREILEALLVEHTQREDDLLVPEWRPLAVTLGFGVDDDAPLKREWEPADLSADARTYDDGDNAIEAINEIAPFAVRERAPTRIGNRMGRPEKSETRELSPAVHTLFPIGDAGGDQRSVGDAADQGNTVEGTKGRVRVEVGRRECAACGERTFRPRCPDCGSTTRPVYECPDCEVEVETDDGDRAECPRCGTAARPTQRETIDVGAELESSLESVGERAATFETLKGVKGLTSREKTPEPLEKGILRAKHGVSAFKDGTVRYDMTDLPVTSVRPAELDVTAEQFRELGYDVDVHGDPLEHDDQLVELKVQDVILSEGAAEHLERTADFVDDLLESYYDLEPYYDVDGRGDLVGELVFGMAPHTSAAVVGRVIGFTKAAVGYAHPYFHASKRRNCFHPETKIWYQCDGWGYEEIESVVEQLLDDPEEDDFGTLVEELDERVYVPAHTSDGKQVLRPVEAVSKHPAPDHLVRVTTRSGREITVTPDHRMHVYDQDLQRLVGVHASELEQTDKLATPQHLDSIQPSGSIARFDLLEEFIDSDVVGPDRLMVKGLEKDRLYTLFEETFSDEYDDEEFYPLKSTAEILDLSNKTLSNYLYRESIPVSILQECFDGVEDLLSFVPEDARLGVKRDRTEIARFVELNERTATLLGYYAAEGFTREQQTSKGTVHQLTICGTESEAREFFKAVLREEFGVAPYEENHAKITASGRLFRAFFDDVLDCGLYAHLKRVPQCIFDASDEIVASYLRGYFSGDGGVSKYAMVVEATTVSEDLKEDLLALLTRMGITANVRQSGAEPLAEKFPDYYPLDDGSVSAVSWIVSISSKDAVRFQQEVGLHLSRKDRRLREHVETKTPSARRVYDGGAADTFIDPIEEIEVVKSNTESVYCLTVEGTHTLVANDLSEKQCDGDEDCVMLLMDGLLNFSKTYLPDKRGGSVAADSRLVAVDPADNVRFMSFEEFWRELESPLEVDGKFHKRTCYAEGWRTYAFDGNQEASLQPIEKAIRYQADADETLLEIETQFGRSLTITGHHSLFRYDDGIEEVAGSDLQPGDLVVAPRELPLESRWRTYDAVDCVEEPYVFIGDHVEDLLRTAWETTGHGSRTHQAFRYGLSYRLSKNKIAYDRLEGILETVDLAVPSDVTVGRAGSTHGIPRSIEVDEDLAWLLGLFVAEGTLSSTCPAIHNADEYLVDHAAQLIKETLDHEPGRRWSNKAYELRFPAVFDVVLFELGFADVSEYNSAEKVVPDCILHAPREVVLAFLRGFIAGDGSDTSDENATTVAFHTTSEDVADGIVFLLHRLGLVANVSEMTDRPGNRQNIYSVTVSGGATDNPLHRLLEGDDPYLSKSLVVPIPDSLMEIREMDISDVKQLVPKYLKRRDNISLEKLREILEELAEKDLPAGAREGLDDLRTIVDGDLSYLRIEQVNEVDYDGHLYDLQVGGEPIFTANWLYAHNSMDAPLVMSSRVDPSEIDDEAHNIDVVEQYPLAFYEATRELADPEAVDVTLAAESVGTDDQYRGFRHTHDTSNIAAGPSLSAYKTLGSMEEKMDAQLDLARTLRAVDEADVAERVIEYHFLPDLIGNLRAFSRQETRCHDCGRTYRRMPLSYQCRECGGDVHLTVHEGSVTKYLETARRVAAEYGAREYTRQRLEILERSIDRIFENDRNKQSGIADFM